jgi:hypothetical protein
VTSAEETGRGGYDFVAEINKQQPRPRPEILIRFPTRLPTRLNGVVLATKVAPFHLLFFSLNHEETIFLLSFGLLAATQLRLWLRNKSK